MNVLRAAVPNGHGYRLSFARTDTGEMCCMVDSAEHLCSPCKEAYVLGQRATLRAEAASLDGVTVPRLMTAADVFELRRELGGCGENFALALAGAMMQDAVKCGTYTLALRRAGREPEPLTYRTEGNAPPKPYTIALARRKQEKR